MTTNKGIRPLSEEFLQGLLQTCFESTRILSSVCIHLTPDLFPSRNYEILFTKLKEYFSKHKASPQRCVFQECIGNDQGAHHLWRVVCDASIKIEEVECAQILEDYIRGVKFQKAYKLSGQYYNRGDFKKAIATMKEYIDWERGFSLTESEYVDIISTFKTRYNQNKIKNEKRNSLSAITHFYIDELDERNNGRDLRTQLTCILASTGVGKSHAARWIGKNACMEGFNVLHIQLEGSEEEVENAYSATLTGSRTFDYEHGTIRDAEVERMSTMLQEISGKLFIRSFPKFNSHVSTMQIKEAITELREKHDTQPDIVIIDSMDLLIDASGRKYGENGERYKRMAVANDLKDLAGEENVWVVATYQSTIENQEWVNDEKNVFNEYNIAEAKGLSRPLTHLITLNQSTNERREHTMRINVAKSRFFDRGDVFKIATDYEHEIFYDRQRTESIKNSRIL